MTKLLKQTLTSVFGKVWSSYSEVRLGLHLQGNGSIWNRQEIGTGKPCVYMEPRRSTLDRLSYLVPNGFACESDPVWNCTVSRVVPRPCEPNKIQAKPVPEWIRSKSNRTTLISCKRSLKQLLGDFILNFKAVPLEMENSLTFVLIQLRKGSW